MSIPWTTTQTKFTKHNKTTTQPDMFSYLQAKEVRWFVFCFGLGKDLLERGKASVGDSLSFPLHWSPKGQPQASAPLIRVLEANGEVVEIMLFLKEYKWNGSNIPKKYRNWILETYDIYVYRYIINYYYMCVYMYIYSCDTWLVLLYSNLGLQMVRPLWFSTAAWERCVSQIFAAKAGIFFPAADENHVLWLIAWQRCCGVTMGYHWNRACSGCCHVFLDLSGASWKTSGRPRNCGQGQLCAHRLECGMEPF